MNPNPDRYKCERIKKLVEEAASVDDIGKRTRHRPFPELKKIYSKLCKIYTQASFQVIGDVLGKYDHATILHAVKTFDDLQESNGLDCLLVFEEVFLKIKDNKNLLKKPRRKPADPDAKVSFIKLVEKYRSIIRKKDARIKALEQFILDNELETLKKY